MIHYISTRGLAPTLGFADVTLTGLARDGGLYVPDAYPIISAEELANMAHQSYLEIAWRVILPFVVDDIPSADLMRLLQASYKKFSHPEIAPLHQFQDNFYLLELFHGPTLAFKDVALQFLGQVFDYLLQKKQQKITIVGATSGDTGSAAIEAFQGKENVNIFILHPHGRVSEVQRRQMTTVQAANVFNIAVEGSFDDCQDIVKALFNDEKCRNELHLSAVNSINWARILAQVVYYVYATSRLHAKTGKPVTFSVPTGNFGNVYAGYVARSMGLPIEKLLVATNSNDILHRFFATGRMQTEAVVPTLSPSMDIQISSNFERLLFDLCGRNGEAVGVTMKHFREVGAFKLSDEMMAQVKNIFYSGKVTDADTLELMQYVYQTKDYILDPHTAVGMGVAGAYLQENPDAVVVALATAHPAKFAEAVKLAIGIEPPVPSCLFGLLERPEKFDILPADFIKIQNYIRARVQS